MGEQRRKPQDVLDDLLDLRRQATEERSHYYVKACVDNAIAEIVSLRSRITALEDVVQLVRPTHD